MKTTAILLLAQLTVLLIAPGCGNGNGPSQEATPVTAVDLPAGFPEDLPIYPDASVLQSDALEEFLVVQLVTEDSLRDVVRFYEKALSEGHWEILSSSDIPAQGAHVFQFTAPELTSPGTVLVSKVPGRTAISITLPSLDQ